MSAENISDTKLGTNRKQTSSLSTWGGEHTLQHTDDVLQNCTPETYVIL